MEVPVIIGVIYINGTSVSIRNAYTPIKIWCSITNNLLYIDTDYYYNSHTITYAYNISDDVTPTEIIENFGEKSVGIQGEVIVGGVLYLIAFDYMGDNGTCYLFRMDNSNGQISFILEKTLQCKRPSGYDTTSYTVARRGVVSKDGKNLIYILGNVSSGNVKNACIVVQDISNILTVEESSELEYKQYTSLSNFNFTGKNEVWNQNQDSTRIFIGSSGLLTSLTTSLDIENIIGVKYKNQFFMKTQNHLLTAGGGDVRAGKTYIGWMGYPETGTAEF